MNRAASDNDIYDVVVVGAGARPLASVCSIWSSDTHQREADR